MQRIVLDAPVYAPNFIRTMLDALMSLPAETVFSIHGLVWDEPVVVRIDRDSDFGKVMRDLCRARNGLVRPALSGLIIIGPKFAELTEEEREALIPAKLAAIGLESSQTAGQLASEVVLPRPVAPLLVTPRSISVYLYR